MKTETILAGVIALLAALLATAAVLIGMYVNDARESRQRTTDMIYGAES